MVEISDLIPQIIKLRESFDKYRAQYINSHNTFSKNRDARITIFSRCIAVLDSTLLFIMFRTFQLKKDEWWSSLPEEYRNLGILSNTIQSPPPGDRDKIIKVVDFFWLFSYVILLFSSLESSLRTIVRVVYPNKYNDGRGDLTQIYQALLSTNFSCYKDLLELFRLSRNTSHNNGVYFPVIKGDNRVVTYNDVSYYFKDGKMVQFGDLAEIMFFEITPGLLNMINDIVNSPDVSKQSQIIDPSVLLEFLF
jgi:hypothetical protein